MGINGGFSISAWVYLNDSVYSIFPVFSPCPVHPYKSKGDMTSSVLGGNIAHFSEICAICTAFKLILYSFY